MCLVSEEGGGAERKRRRGRPTSIALPAFTKLPLNRTTPPPPHSFIPLLCLYVANPPLYTMRISALNFTHAKTHVHCAKFRPREKSCRAVCPYTPSVTNSGSDSGLRSDIGGKSELERWRVSGCERERERVWKNDVMWCFTLSLSLPTILYCRIYIRTYIVYILQF